MNLFQKIKQTLNPEIALSQPNKPDVFSFVDKMRPFVSALEKAKQTVRSGASIFDRFATGVSKGVQQQFGEDEDGQTRLQGPAAMFKKMIDTRSQLRGMLAGILPSHTIEIDNSQRNKKLEYEPRDPSLLITGKSVDTITPLPKELEARAIKNNNPTNVRAKGEKENFYHFKDVAEGIKGGYSDLMNKLSGKGEITNEILKEHEITQPTIGDLMLIHVVGDIDYNNEEGKKYLKDLQDNTGIPHWLPVKSFMQYPEEQRKLLFKGMMRNESSVFFQRHRNLVDSL